MAAGTIVAVVDDDEAARQSLVALVRALGFATAGFRSAADYLGSDVAPRTACLIADVRMPGVGGIELHARLARSGRPVPTILVTAFPDEATCARSLGAGVAIYLAKPAEPDEVLRFIRAALSHQDGEPHQPKSLGPHGMRPGSQDDAPRRRHEHPHRHDRSRNVSRTAEARGIPHFDQLDEEQPMTTIITKDGTEIFYKDWGSGPPVVFSHGWPLSADAWEAQMVHLASNGFRCIAHDRRGHGRSSQPWNGNEMDTYADDLAALIEQLDLHDAMLVGHSTGGGEVARTIGRHGTGRVSRAVLVSAVAPIMVRTGTNPEGVPLDVFDDIRAGVEKDRSQFFRDLTVPFFGANRDGHAVSQGMRDAFWLQGMMGGLKNELDCIEAFSETDFTDDLKRMDVPTLVIHGDDDQIVPFATTGRRSAEIAPRATLRVYSGGAHGLADTARERLNTDLLDFAMGR